jgi:hypothetical protein
LGKTLRAVTTKALGRTALGRVGIIQAHAPTTPTDFSPHSPTNGKSFTIMRSTRKALQLRRCSPNAAQAEAT